MKKEKVRVIFESTNEIEILSDSIVISYSYNFFDIKVNQDIQKKIAVRISKSIVMEILQIKSNYNTERHNIIISLQDNLKKYFLWEITVRPKVDFINDSDINIIKIDSNYWVQDIDIDNLPEVEGYEIEV